MKNKLKFIQKNIIWLVLLLIIIVSVSFLKFTKKVDELTLKNENLYQYLTGIKIEYKGKITLNKNNNKITEISFQNANVELDSTPIYYKKSPKVIFPENMSVVKMIDGTQERASYYSTLYQDTDYCVLESGKKKQTLNNAILYDGKDLYFFVDKVKVKFQNNEIDLEPMSYIIADNFNKQVEVYDYNKDDYQIYKDNDSEVMIEHKDYKVNATFDLYYNNNKSRLLIKDLTKLKKLL